MSLSVERAPGRIEGGEGRGGLGPIGLTLVLGAGLLLFYVVVYPLFGLHATIGSDSPVYAWWARVGGTLGMGPVGSGARPGSVGLVATLAGVTPAPAAGVVAGLIPALAVATGLAAGALADLALGPDRARFCLVAAFVAAYLSLLTDGYLSTLAFAAAFVAALACMAAVLPGTGARPPQHDASHGVRAFAAGALILTAGVAHPLFLTLAGGVVVAGVLALLPAAIRAAKDGTPLWRSGAARIAAAALAGIALTPAGLLLSGGFDGTTVDTSRDAFVRRAGVGSLRSSYLHKLSHDFAWYRAVVVVGLAATPLVVRGTTTGDRGERRRFLWGVSFGWVLIAAAAVALLLAGTALPGQRLLATCLALPLLGGVGLARLWRGPAAVHRWMAGVGALLFLALAWSRWLGERPPVSDPVVADARQVAVAVAGEPAGTPVVVVMDDRGATPTLRAIAYANQVRAALAPEGPVDVWVFLGKTNDYLAGRPTITGRAEHDASSRQTMAAVRRLNTPPAAVVVRAFDPPAFVRALALPGSTRVQPDVVTLPGSRALAQATPDRLGAVGGGPQSPWLPVWSGALLLTIAGLAGWPIASLVLEAEPARPRAALAPAAGFAALSLASVLVDGVGLHLSATGGWVALALAALPGWALLARRRAA
jgi:hypothetical protein